MTILQFIRFFLFTIGPLFILVELRTGFDTTFAVFGATIIGLTIQGIHFIHRLDQRRPRFDKLTTGASLDRSSR